MTPRLLTKKQAAEYLNYSPHHFDQLVKSDLIPSPVFGGRRYDKEAIDRALDRASGIPLERIADTAAAAYDEWKTGREQNGKGRT